MKPAHQDEMNAMLESVDCSPGAIRKSAVAPQPGTSGTPAPAFYVSNYQLSFMMCRTGGIAGPEKLYVESGTRDPRKAAEWLGAASTKGLARDGSVDGCFDALTGNPNRFPR